MTVLSVVALGGCFSENVGPPPVPEEVTSVLDLPEGSMLPPGRYRVPFVGLDQDVAEAEVDVREGFEIFNGSFLWHGSDDDPSYALSFWRVTGVSPGPCRSVPATYSDPGPTIPALASALRRQPQRRGPAPVPVTLAGYEGLYLELSLRDGFDPARCATGSYEAWRAVNPKNNASYDRYQYGPGYVDRIWILDVEGERLVVNAAFDRRVGEDALSGLEAMVESISIRVEDPN